MESSFLQYWGKTSSEPDSWHRAFYHALDVAAVGKTLLNDDPLLRRRLTTVTGWDEETVVRFITFWLGVHDLGKFTESFQGNQPNLFLKQFKREPLLEYLLHHTMLGQRLWEDIVFERLYQEGVFGTDAGSLREQKRLLKPVSNAAFGHHGLPSNRTEMRHFTAEQLYTQENINDACDAVRCCADLLLQGEPLLPPGATRQDKAALTKLSWILAGLVVLADWIGSNAQYFPFHPEEMAPENYWTRIALPQAEHAIAETGIRCRPISEQSGLEAIFPVFSEKGFAPSPLQDYATGCPIGNGPHLFLIEESTGGGKTEAAIALAHRLMQQGEGSGVYVGLPTMATANAMYERMAESYVNLYAPGEEPDLILAHAARNHSDLFLSSLKNNDGRKSSVQAVAGGENDTAPEIFCSRWIADNRKKALLASFGVGTIDQALISVLPIRHQSLRLFGLLRNVLIVDEVHAYDSYMARLLQQLLRFLAALGSSVILLSATLPASMKADFVRSFAEGAGWETELPASKEYPLVTHLSAAGLSEKYVPARTGTGRTVNVELVHNEDVIVSRIEKVLADGGCACWIRNTVQDAKDACGRFSGRIPDEKLTLFHSRFTLCDRLIIENEVLKHFGRNSTNEERAGRLVVATQVVEQSLDIDFDFMVTDLAPIDLIVQRAGRLQRHSYHTGRDEPVLWVFSPEIVAEPAPDWYSEIFPRAAYVYPAHGELYLTACLLAERGELKTPEDARYLIESVYGEDSAEIPAGLVRQTERAAGQQTHDAALASENSLNLRNGYEYGRNRWGTDEDTPTRLGDATVTLRLGRYDPSAGTILPWDDGGAGRWDRSQVSVRQITFPGKPVYDDVANNAVAAATETMPDHGAWTILLPLEEQDSNIWGGVFSVENGDIVTVTYSPLEGLSLTKQAR